MMSDFKRGQSAKQPNHIPLRGWWDIAKRIIKQMSRDNLSLVAAGVAFYALLAIFPAIAALVSVYAYFASPNEISAYLSQFMALLPQSTQEIILSQVSSLAQKSQTSLSLSALGTLLLTIWSSSKGSQALITDVILVITNTKNAHFLRRNLYVYYFQWVRLWWRSLHW